MTTNTVFTVNNNKLLYPEDMDSSIRLKEPLSQEEISKLLQPTEHDE